MELAYKQYLQRFANNDDVSDVMNV